MKVQREKISKNYNIFDLQKITNVLRADVYNATELKEIFEDSFSIIEDFINKDVALTLNHYGFFDIHTSRVILDEGNYLTISAITINGVVIPDSDYVVYFDSNRFEIKFNQQVDGDLDVYFYCGYTNNAINKTIRRALYIIINDLYDSERSSYTLGSSKKSDILDRLLSPHRKTFFHNYNCSHFNIF